MSITSEIERIQTAKNDIATSLTNKGVTVPSEARIDEYAPMIDEIETGGNYQEKVVKPEDIDVTVLPDEGYDALSSVTVSAVPLEAKTVTPTAQGLIVEPQNGNVGLSSVTIMGDVNLVPSNVKNGVTIFDIIGSYEGSNGTGDLSWIGSEIDVEAQTTISVGDRIVGRRNTKYVAPTLSTSNNGAGDIGVLSKDGTVGLINKSLSATADFEICFLNSAGSYDVYFFGHEDLSEVFAKLNISTINLGNFGLNNNGSMATYIGSCNDADIENYVYYLFIINIDKENKTATLKVQRNPLSMDGWMTDLCEMKNIIGVNSQCWVDGYLWGNFNVKCDMYEEKNNSKVYTETTYTTVPAVYKCDGNSISLIYKSTGALNLYERWLIGVKVDDTFIMQFVEGPYDSGKFVQYKIVDDETIEVYKKGATSSLYITALSKNGQYFTSHASVNDNTAYLYQINWADMSYTRISTCLKAADNNITYPSEDGTMVLSPATGVWKLNNSGTLEKIFPFTNKLPLRGTFDGKRWVTSTTTYTIVPNTEAEYLIDKATTSSMEVARMYGIANENLTAGMRGTARGLFNTFNLGEEERTLPSDYQAVEYLESTGTQYINTNIEISSTNFLKFKMEIDIQTISTTSNVGIGVGTGGSSNAIYVGMLSNSWAYGNGRGDTQTGVASDFSRHTHIYDATKMIYIRDGLITQMTLSTPTTANTLYLFAYHRDSETRFRGNHRIFRAKFYIGNLIADFVPCYRKSDNVAGMYDLINDVFYTNSGTGVFVIGGEI